MIQALNPGGAKLVSVLCSDSGIHTASSAVALRLFTGDSVAVVWQWPSGNKAKNE
jgi:hypothetical protein